MIDLNPLKIKIKRIKFNMEYINQKIYTINGVPSSQYGEWAGITSNKWRGSIKVIRPHTTDILNQGNYHF